MKTNARLLTRLTVIFLALSTARCGVVAEDHRSTGSEVADDEGAEGFNIINGAFVPSNADGFGMIGSPGAAGCTAIEIAPRCLLTSAHCAPHFRFYTPDPDPNSRGANPRYVRVLKSLPHSQYSESGNSRKAAANDLALLWTKDWLPSDGRTWNPRRIATTQISSGLGNIYGYSANGSSLATEAKKRQGAVRIYSRAAEAGGGGTYTIYPKTTGTRICASQGDSGGPLLNGSILGVASRGSDNGGACTSLDFTYYTDVAAPANKEFIGQAASFCQPDPFSLIVVARTISGNSTRSVGNKVAVTLRRAAGTSTVEVVDRPDGDIYEKGVRTASLVAVPKSGSSFLRWRPLFGTTYCPCAVGARSTSPRCDVGPTDADVSCVAEFSTPTVGVASGLNPAVPLPAATVPPTLTTTNPAAAVPATSLPASTAPTATTTTTTTDSSSTFVMPK